MTYTIQIRRRNGVLARIPDTSFDTVEKAVDYIKKYIPKYQCPTVIEKSIGRSAKIQKLFGTSNPKWR